MNTVSARPAHPRAVAGATQATLREHNLSLVARIILGATASMSRADVAAATALTRSTVSRLVDDLLAGGLVREVAKVEGGLGRPATPVVADDRLCALGLQVNATFLQARLVALDGTVLAEEAVDGDFVASDPAEVLPRMGACGARVAAAAGDDRTLVGTGLALPGIVRPEAGLLVRAPNLGWSAVEPAALLAAPGLGPVLIGNEADCAAIALAQPVPGRREGPQDFIYLSGEIGIGGAAVLDGQVMRGGTAGPARSGTCAWTRRGRPVRAGHAAASSGTRACERCRPRPACRRRPASSGSPRPATRVSRPRPAPSTPRWAPWRQHW